MYVVQTFVYSLQAHFSALVWRCHCYVDEKNYQQLPCSCKIRQGHVKGEVTLKTTPKLNCLLLSTSYPNSVTSLKSRLLRWNHYISILLLLLHHTTEATEIYLTLCHSHLSHRPHSRNGSTTSSIKPRGLFSQWGTKYRFLGDSSRWLPDLM